MPGLITYIKWYAKQLYLNIFWSITRTKWLSPTTQPDLFKTYSRRDLFATRFFFPAGHDASASYPLVIMLHGGGFTNNNPAADDPLARRLADEAKCIVASIDYRKTPQNPFPAAYDDVVELCVSLIHDTHVRPRIDTSRVAMFGTSAGGNLVLAAAQDSALRGKITGIVAVYPVTEFTTSFEEKMARTNHGGMRDVLLDGYQDMCDFYVGSYQDLRDPRLSPAHFKDKKDLPSKICFIGAEQDLLCTEAQLMAERLAEGQEKIPTAGGWKTAGGIKWDFFPGQVHAFDFIPKEDAREEAVRVETRERMYSDMVKWLRECLSVGSAA